MQDRLRDKVHLQTVQILEREDALTPRMEEAGEAPPRHTPRPPTRGADIVYNWIKRSHVTTRQGLLPDLPTKSNLPWSESPDVLVSCACTSHMAVALQVASISWLW